MSQDLSLNNIGYQSNVRSKPIRENFTDIQNNFNQLRTEVYASIASTASEVVAGRDNFVTLVDNINARKAWGNRINRPNDFLVSVDSLLTVSINSGSAIVNGVGVYHNTSATASVSVPGTAGFERYDVVVLNTDNSRAILAGTSTSGTAQIPNVATTQMPVARWHIFDTTATLSPVDLRYKGLSPFLDEDAMDIRFNYTGDTLSTYGFTDVRDEERSYNIGYTGETISTIGVTVNTNRHVATFTYSGETLTNISHSMS
jgi:hypothetical protein